MEALKEDGTIWGPNKARRAQFASGANSNVGQIMTHFADGAVSEKRAAPPL